jgi:hypothetical protein
MEDQVDSTIEAPDQPREEGGSGEQPGHGPGGGKIKPACRGPGRSASQAMFLSRRQAIRGAIRRLAGGALRLRLC